MTKSGAASNVAGPATDVVVIGAGGSGLAAAVAAAEKGANVVVLEKRKRPGGNSAMAQGLFATETGVQNRLRLTVTRDEAFRIIMDYSHLEVDGRLMRAFIDKSPDTIRWLEEKGIEFDPTSLLYGRHDLPVYHCPKGDRGGADIVKLLLREGGRLGVQLLREAAAVSIRKDGKGKVSGVVASTRGGDVTIGAKSVIIATGGHGSNRELLKKYHSCWTEEYEYKGIPLMGDGIAMAGEVGADTGDKGTLLLHGPQVPDRTVHELKAVTREPFTLWVNRRGARFADESCPFNPVETGNALDRQPGKVSYCLFDDAMRQRIMDRGFERGSAMAKAGQRPTDLEGLLRSKEEKGWVRIAGSWDEIARWIGASPESLKAAIDEYNGFCRQGYDRDFLKDRSHLRALATPPFYGIQCVQTFLDTFGGIRINHRMEVLDQDGETIRGLYAVGVTTSGWQPSTYCIKLSGNAFGFAINSGRIAGEEAAGLAKGWSA